MAKQTLGKKPAKCAERRRPFAVATVVAVRGSASARVSSKAVFDENGKNVWGWIGGGCAEIFVAQNCLESIDERQGRIVEADLDDEILGLGIPCGGIMTILSNPTFLRNFTSALRPSIQRRNRSFRSRPGFSSRH